MICNPETTLYSKNWPDAPSQSPGMWERGKLTAGQGGDSFRMAQDLVSQKVFGTKWRNLFTGRFCRCTLPPAFTATGCFAMRAVLKGVFRTKHRPQESVEQSRSDLQKGICCCPSPARHHCTRTAQADPWQSCPIRWRWMSARRHPRDAGFPVAFTEPALPVIPVPERQPRDVAAVVQMQEGI